MKSAILCEIGWMIPYFKCALSVVVFLIVATIFPDDDMDAMM